MAKYPKPKMKEFNLGKGYKLKFKGQHYWDGRNDYFDNWYLQFRGKDVGEFHLWLDPDKGENHFIDGVQIDSKHQGKGLGKKSYLFFADLYGVIESAYSETSKEARRVWKSINAKKLKSKTGKGQIRFQLKGTGEMIQAAVVLYTGKQKVKAQVIAALRRIVIL